MLKPEEVWWDEWGEAQEYTEEGACREEWWEVAYAEAELPFRYEHTQQQGENVLNVQISPQSRC
jgi:hypothetical protein